MSENTTKNEDVVAKIRRIERSPKGMVDALFDSMDRMMNKEMTPEEGRAISHTVRSVVTVTRLEMDFRKQSAELGGPDAIKSLSFTPTDG